MDTMNDTFGGKIVEIFSVLQTQICGFALMGIEPNSDVLSFSAKFKYMVNVYLNSRNSSAKKFLMACAENADAIRLVNHDVITRLLTMQGDKP